MKIKELAQKNKSELINAIKLQRNPNWSGPGKGHSIPDGLTISEKKYNDEGEDIGWNTETYSWHELRRMSAAEVAVIAWRCKVTDGVFETLYPTSIEEFEGEEE